MVKQNSQVYLHVYMNESNTLWKIEVSEAWYLNIYLTIRYTGKFNCWQNYVLIAALIWLSSVQQTSIPFMFQDYEHLRHILH